MKAVLEGLLFIVGDEGLTINQISDILELEKDEVLNIINELSDSYNNEERGITIKKFGNIYKLTTKSEYKKYYERLSDLSNLKTLSQSALETLAIIAYNEPITRVEVDELRGVNSSQMIRNLIAKDFVKEVGKSDAVGRPNLYGVTDQFLDYFGLESKDDLPKFDEIEVSNEEVELYNSKYTEKELDEEIEEL